MARPINRNGGRPKGSLNKRTRAMREAGRAALEAAEKGLGDRLQELTALDLMRLVYRDTAQPMQMRMTAAAHALKFETPALSASAVGVAITNKREQDYTDQELRDFIARHAAQLPAPDGQMIDLECVENPPQKLTSESP